MTIKTLENMITRVMSVESGKGGIGKTTKASTLTITADSYLADFEKTYGRKANILIQSTDKNSSLFDIFAEERNFTNGYGFKNNVICDFIDNAIFDDEFYLDNDLVNEELKSRLYIKEDGKIWYRKKVYTRKSDEQLQEEYAEKVAEIDSDLESGDLVIQLVADMLEEYQMLRKFPTESLLNFFSKIGLLESIQDEIIPNLDQSLLEANRELDLCKAISKKVKISSVKSACEAYVVNEINNNGLLDTLKDPKTFEKEVFKFNVSVEGEYPIDFLTLDTPANYMHQDFGQDSIFIVHSLGELVSSRTSMEDFIKKTQVQIEKLFEDYVEEHLENVEIPKFFFIMNNKKSGSTKYVEERKNIIQTIENITNSYNEHYGIELDVSVLYVPYINYENFFKHQINFMNDVDLIKQDIESVKAEYREAKSPTEINSSIKSPLQNDEFLTALEVIKSKNIFEPKFI